MWNEICAKIFTEVTYKLEDENIRYFVLRNYKKLPEGNDAKDVDIVIDPKHIKKADAIVREAYSNNDLEYYEECVFDKLRCTHGMSWNKKIGIHIDLICGYRVRGYEIFDFDELYQYVEKYKGFYVLGDYMDGMMLLIYKIFGYKKPLLKDKYREEIYDAYVKYKDEFISETIRLFGRELSVRIIEDISEKNFDDIIKCNKQITKKLKKYAKKKNRFKAFKGHIHFLWQKFEHVILCYRKYKKVIAILGPDGVGKSTFIDELMRQLNTYYVSYPEDRKINLLHFRPNVFPNLGEVGEKTKVMKQDTDFTNPHRSKPANPISSFFRIGYYTLDYIFGWQKVVRADVQNDRITMFDRYSYDFIVDPHRSKLKLPKWLRKVFVRLTPQPGIVFILEADADTIYSRKKELSREEIERQLEEYKLLAKSNKRFVMINAERKPYEMADEASKNILEKYAK
ncbi:MAG: hypothetical protein IJ883_01925 [Eubacterium sp.]|nr:hypothetical protein [Eubacterium sp.]